MRRLFLFLLFTILVPASSYAASKDYSGDKTEYQVLRCRFSGEVNKKDEKGTTTQYTEGKIVIVPGRGAILALDKPKPGMVVFTKEHMALIVYDNLAARTDAEKHPELAQMANLFADAMTGKWESFEPFFSIEHRGDKDNWSVKLKTRAVDKTKIPFSIITAGGGAFITALGLVEPNGSYTSYKLFDHKVETRFLAKSDLYLFNLADTNISTGR
jgi:hypothetical protein